MKISEGGRGRGGPFERMDHTQLIQGFSDQTKVASSEVQKSRVFQGCFTVFSRAFPGFLEVQNENNIHNEM